MKRKLFYILSLALFFSFASCEKEEINEAPTEDSTPSDDEPIEVPEGYFYARFLGSVGTQTRAEANSEAGTHNRITHLQYVIYQREQNTGTETGDKPYKVYKVNTVFDNTSSTGTSVTWPYTGRTIGEILPSGFDYRVVFLGNMSSGLFKRIDDDRVSQTDSIVTSIGIGDLYKNARIHLPKGEFNDHSCFYWSNVEFTSDTRDVNIVLQRIVNRVDIRKEPITETGYEKQLVKNHLEKSLLEADGAFTKQVCAILDTLAASYAYMGANGYGNSNTNMATDAVNLSKWPVLNLLNENYLTNDAKKYIKERPTEVDAEPAGIWYSYQYATTTSTSGSAYDNNALVNIGQYLYNLTHTPGYDNGKLTAIVNYLWALKHQNYTYTDTDGPAFTATESDPIDIFASNLHKKIREKDEFWRGIASFDKYLGASSPTENVYFRIITENMPSSIDFDRNVIDRLNDGGETSLVIKRRYDNTVKDGYLSVYSIGGTDNLNIKEIKSLSATAYSTGNLEGWITDSPTDGQTYLPIKTQSETLQSKREANTYYKSLMTVTSMNITDQNKYEGDKSLISFNLRYIFDTLIGFSEINQGGYVFPAGDHYKLSLGSLTLYDYQAHATLAGLNKIIYEPIFALHEAQGMEKESLTEHFYGLAGYPFHIKFPLLDATNFSYDLQWNLTDNSGNPVTIN